MKCIETRKRDGFTYRRYMGPNGPVATYEVPIAVVRNIGMQAFKDAAAMVARGVERRRRAAEVREAVTKRLAAGWKPTAIAHDLGISDARVRQIRKEVK